MTASSKGYSDVVRYLLDKGADVNCKYEVKTKDTATIFQLINLVALNSTYLIHFYLICMEITYFNYLLLNSIY